MPTSDTSPKVLVLADIWCNLDRLCLGISRHIDNSARVLVVAPALASRLHLWTNDTDRESAITRARLETILVRLERYGIHAEGRLADQDPALAVDDALCRFGFAATEVIVITEDDQHANWAERGLDDRIGRHGIPVTHLTVAHEQSR
jgi:hypothetical protein